MASLLRLPFRAIAVLRFRAFAVGSLVVAMFAAAALVLGAVGATSAGASPTAPTLGDAAPFAVLATATVTNTGPTVVTGDLGVYAGTAVTGFTTTTATGSVKNGSKYHTGTTTARTAQAGLLIAYGEAAAAPSTATFTQLAGKTLTSGVYTASTGMALTGTLTLTGTSQSVFIFQAGTTLIAGAGSHVILDTGVQACNVFWQVGSAATLKTGTDFSGTIMATATASLGTTVVLTGRVLSMSGAVTLLSDHVTVPTCVPPATITTSAPSATLVKLGASVHDVVTVSGNTVDGVPTGSVQFYQCGPPSLLCASTSGTPISAAVTLAGGIAASSSFTPGAIGTYCFAAVYTPAAGSPYTASSEAGSTTNGECFTVSAAPGVPPVITPPPTVTTSASSATLVTLGTSVHDVVTVTGNAADGVPTGSVQFYQCGPPSILCASTSGTPLPGTVTLAAGVAASPSFTPGAIGTYCFAAVYLPALGSPYVASSEAGSATNGECFTVTAAPGVPPVITPPPTVTTSRPSSTSVTLGARVHDVVTVTGNAVDGVPTGSVQFYQCGPPSILCASTSGTPISGAVTLAGGIAASSSFTPGAIGTYCFAAVYVPALGSPYVASSEAGSATNGECFTVTAARHTLTTHTHTKPASAVVPSTHTGEPWAGWVWWFLVAVLGASGIALLADLARRRRLGHGEGG